MLHSPSLNILNQQIRIKREIKTLTDEESRDYIEHRLNLVGIKTSEIFTPAVISVIIKYAKGIPRVINIVCDNALLNGFSESKKKIDAKIIREVIKNLEGPVLRKTISTRIFRFLKKTNLIRHKKILSPQTMAEYNSSLSIHILDFISQRQIAVIFLSLLGLVGIVILMYGLLVYGSANRWNIESKWTSFFQTERHLVTAPKTATTKTSKVDVHYPSAETRAKIVESPQSAMTPSASSMPLRTKTISTETFIVKEGQSISLLAQKYYGISNITLVDLILDSNPEITNAHLISVNQKIRMPKITERSLIIKFSDHSYKIHVGTFRSPEYAEFYKNEPSLRGKKIEIIARKKTPKETWYKVVVGKFNSEDEVLKAISILKERNLLPLFGAVPKLK
jgi:hypothetical protein